jgi:protocatechuate 3,4-dioxygenase beta subunit
MSLVRRVLRRAPLKTRWAAALLLLLPFSFACATSARGQESKQDKKAEAQLRTVRGAVLDKDENPAPSSVVYLLNVKTQGVRTLFADDSGHYRFSGLDPNVDYDIHAEHDDLTSATRKVSSFDSRRDIEVNLKLNHPKNSK